MGRSLLLLLLICLASPILAQSSPESGSEGGDSLELFNSKTEKTPLGWDRLSVSLGYMSMSAGGTYKIGLPSGRKVLVLDLDRLGVDDEDGTYWATIHWRSRESRWGAWFGTWQFDAAGQRVWENELKIGDEIIVPVGAGVTTDMVADWYILEGTYSFVRTRTADIGIGVGVHAVDLDATLTGSLRVFEQETEIVNKTFDTLAPLPNVLGYAYWKFADRWRLTARYGWFGLKYDDYDGQMTNLHALLRFDLSRRWAIEGGYQFVKLDLDIEKKNFTSIFDLDFKGPMAVVRFSF